MAVPEFKRQKAAENNRVHERDLPAPPRPERDCDNSSAAEEDECEAVGDRCAAEIVNGTEQPVCGKMEYGELFKNNERKQKGGNRKCSFAADIRQGFFPMNL